MIKEKFLKLQKKIGNNLSWIPLSANQITIFSIIIAFFASYFLYLKNPISIFLILLCFLIDGLDGAIARSKKQVSNFGAYLDGISDRIVEFFIILPFFFHEKLIFPSIILLFFGTCLTSFSKAYASHRKIMKEKDSSKIKTYFARTERVILIFLCAFLFIYNFLEITEYLLWFGAILSFISFFMIQIFILKEK